MALIDLLKDPSAYRLLNPSKGISYPDDSYNTPPLVQRVEWPIDSKDAEPNFLEGGKDHKSIGSIDGLVLRGGIDTNIDRREIDFKRISRFLFNTPQGSEFLTRQTALQLLQPQENQRVFNGKFLGNFSSLLTQVAVSGLSNFKRSGAIPTPVDSKGLDFTFNLGPLGSIGTGGDYVSMFTDEEKLTTNFNLGDPGSISPKEGLSQLIDLGGLFKGNRPKNPKEYAAGTITGEASTWGKLDKINLLDVIQSSDGSLPQDISPWAKDMVNFRFEVINQDDFGASDFIIFRAFLDSYGDTFNANHNSVKYNGRGEEFYTYNSFNRQISINFKIAAQSRYDMFPLYRKLNYLAAQTAPSYSKTGRIRTPYMKLTMGDYFAKLPGLITSLDISWQKDYTWEIALDPEVKTNKKGDNIEGTGRDRNMLVLPHVLDISLNYQPIHGFTPNNRFTSPFIGIDRWLEGDMVKKANNFSTALTHGDYMDDFSKLRTTADDNNEKSNEENNETNNAQEANIALNTDVPQVPMG